MLLKLADAIEANAEELAKLESIDTGHPLRDTRGLDVVRTAVTFRYFGGMADKFQGSVVPVEQGFLNYVLREPVGVVGQIVPWNFPLMFTGWKMGPALAAGNTVVMKPAELTPLSTLKIAELARNAGFPKGVINILPGYGNIAGQVLAEHPGVDKIAFTGSTATGRKIVQASSGNLKRVQLELGGKGANIVFDDANLADAVPSSVWSIYYSAGQSCEARSRVLVEKSIYDDFVSSFSGLAEQLKLGDPLDPETQVGSLISASHRERVHGFVEQGRDEGCGSRDRRKGRRRERCVLSADRARRRRELHDRRPGGDLRPGRHRHPVRSGPRVGAPAGRRPARPPFPRPRRSDAAHQPARGGRGRFRPAAAPARCRGLRERNARRTSTRPLTDARIRRVLAVASSSLADLVPHVLAVNPAAAVKVGKARKVKPLLWTAARTEQ